MGFLVTKKVPAIYLFVSPFTSNTLGLGNRRKDPLSNCSMFLALGRNRVASAPCMVIGVLVSRCVIFCLIAVVVC